MYILLLFLHDSISFWRNCFDRKLKLNENNLWMEILHLKNKNTRKNLSNFSCFGYLENDYNETLTQSEFTKQKIEFTKNK